MPAFPVVLHSCTDMSAPNHVITFTFRQLLDLYNLVLMLTFLYFTSSSFFIKNCTYNWPTGSISFLTMNSISISLQKISGRYYGVSHSNKNVKLVLILRDVLISLMKLKKCYYLDESTVGFDMREKIYGFSFFYLRCLKFN